MRVQFDISIGKTVLGYSFSISVRSSISWESSFRINYIVTVYKNTSSFLINTSQEREVSFEIIV